MPPDGVRIEDTRTWLLNAARDLRAGEAALASAEPIPEDAVFHAQQAAEKALKAFLAWHDIPFRKTHDLREVGRQCVTVESTLAPLCERAEILTPFAWQFRYPAEHFQEVPAADARQALDLAREVFDAVLAHLPEEARP
jgi:HEPN domain-containing protein